MRSRAWVDFSDREIAAIVRRGIGTMWRSAGLWGALAVAAVLGTVCSGVGGGADGAADARLQVVVSTSVIADWVGEVGGDRITVTMLAEAGVDAHTLQLEPSQVVAIVEADLVILNGAGLEAGFAGVVEENARGPVVELARGVELEGFGWGSAGGIADPHFWLDPERAIVAVGVIREALIAEDAKGAASYRENALLYTEAIREAGAEVAAVLSALPAERRMLVTFHDAFGYFARRHGLTVLGFVVEGPEGEPSAADVAELVELMEREGVRIIYREPQFSAAVVDRVAEETGAEVRHIYSLLWGEVSTYLELLRANAAALSDSDSASRDGGRRSS